MPRKKAKDYAGALFAVARKNDIVDPIKESLNLVLYLHEKDMDFRVFFYTTKVEPSEKVNVFSSSLGDYLHTAVIGFLGLLAERKEQELLREVVNAFDVLYRRQMNVVSVTAITSIALEKGEYEQIHRRLKRSLDKRVDMETHVDPRLIGGLKLRIGNTFVDGSIATQLEKMKQSLL